jgi:hypothetical protein
VVESSALFLFGKFGMTHVSFLVIQFCDPHCLSRRIALECLALRQLSE